MITEEGDEGYSQQQNGVDESAMHDCGEDGGGLVERLTNDERKLGNEMKEQLRMDARKSVMDSAYDPREI